MVSQESAMGLALLLAQGSTPVNLSMFDPASAPALSIRNLTILVLAITGAIFVIVEGVLIYSLMRFRGRAGSAEPPQVYGSQPIEIAWTAAPALIVFVIMLVTARTLGELQANPQDPPAGSKPLHVTVIGRQWWWEFDYDRYGDENLGFATANELHVPVGTDGVPRPVYLTLKSADVCHSFWVPRLAGKTDLIPGRTNTMWFQPDKPELYLGQCAEYCGTQHANMLLRVYAETAEDFERWLSDQKAPAERNPAGTEGRGVFLGQSCVNCHRIRGTPAAGTYAPDLTHLMSRKTLAAGMIPNTPEQLRDWVQDPQKIKPGCLMPAFGLSASERDQIVSYLLTLR
jgi:cytochrome c oxidase subunit 2